jgi:anthranilate/para-aminobenzoate synthase component II
MHGKVSVVKHEGSMLFKNIPEAFPAMRYHSLVLDEIDNTDLIVTSRAADDGTIMSLQHHKYPCTGIQFHPESVGTEYGLQLLKNWAEMY